MVRAQPALLKFTNRLLSSAQNHEVIDMTTRYRTL
jgi:hypothetical protein